MRAPGRAQGAAAQCLGTVAHAAPQPALLQQWAVFPGHGAVPCMKWLQGFWLGPDSRPYCSAQPQPSPATLCRLGCYALMPLAPSAWFILPVELLHGISFALGWGASIVHCKRIAPPNLCATVQVCNQCTCLHQTLAAGRALEPASSPQR
jgi:hypothetical protein